MSSTRLHPATAFWPSLMVSAAIWTGSMNSVTRKRNDATRPTVTCPVDASSVPATITAAVAAPLNTSLVAENPTE